jgi:predicted permease
MSATTTTGYATAPGRVRLSRALGVAGATAAAVALWTLAVPLLGIHLLVRFGNSAPENVGIGFVIGASLVGSLLGWGLLAMLERHTARARTIWTGVAAVLGLMSLSLPLSAGTTTSTRIVLALMHLAVAAVLIPTLRQSAPARAVSSGTPRSSASSTLPMAP